MEEPSAKRYRTYQVGAGVAKDRIARERPDLAAALEQVEASDVVVVTGSYDRVEQVLQALGTPFELVSPEMLTRLSLRPEQLLVINCPGQVDPEAIGTIRSFVERGGSLFTTDWALRHVIEPAFPGILRFNERPTADTVVRIEVTNGEHRFLRGVLDATDDPIWWLEGSSYPITLLAPDRVEVLITSNELAEKWGEPTVAVHFRYGEGEVFHMISHYYLQRTELRTRRHQSAAAEYFTEKGVTLDPGMAAMAADLQLGDVESAASSSRLMANVISAKKAEALAKYAREAEARRKKDESAE